MDARDVVEHFVTSENRVHLLRILREGPASQSDLSDCCSMSLPTVSRRCDDLEERGWVQIHADQYKLTGAGAIVLRTYDNAVETVGRNGHNDLDYLAGSENRVRFLRALQDGPTEEAELKDDLSKSTVQRHKDGLSERGFINWYGSDCRLTVSGEHALNVYDSLLRTIEQVEDKNSFLRNIGVRCAGLPAETLSEAEVVYNSYSHPVRIADRFRERVERGFDHCWVLSSRYTEADVAAVHRAIDDGAKLTVMSPLPSHDVLPTDSTELKYMRRGINRNAIDWRIYPNELPINMVVFDANEVMLITTDQPGEEQQVQAMLRSENDELVTWALNLLESYHNESKPPLTYLYTRLRNAGVNEVLSYIDILPKPITGSG
ncbi:MarR family transcriptional regulator [Halococcus sp. AFM35]|uniref:transcriptional regulator FilR1 domain-containing protein n=1 Tax=Halococcus sp. AFM35 TaxID=3421653 RepID=UPI003EC051B1